MGTGRRHLAVAGAAIMLTWTLAACGNAERDRADRVTAAIAALPGVASATGGVDDRFYRLDVTVAETTDLEQVTAIGRTYRDQVDPDDFSDHRLLLTLTSADGRGELTWLDGPEDPFASPALWWGLIENLSADAEFEMRVQGPLVTIEVSTDDVVATLQDAATVGTDLDHISWTVTEPGELTVLHSDGHPSSRILDWLPDLVTDEDHWTVAYHQDDLVPIRTQAETTGEGGDPEAIARHHLDLVAALGLPVVHTEGPVDDPFVLVAVGDGCLDNGSTLQQELNREYGTC